MTENESIRRHFWTSAFRLAAEEELKSIHGFTYAYLVEYADTALKEYDKRFKELDDMAMLPPVNVMESLNQ